MKKNKKKILKTIGKVALLLGIIVAIALASFFILRACGFTTTEKFIELRDTMGESIWFWAIIVALQTFQVVFIPISNSIISAPMAVVFNNELWKVFLSSWLGIEIGTIILYFLGRYGGTKILNFLLGDKEKTEKCKNFMKKGKAFYPIGMLIFILPDDILTTLAGTSKYNFWYVLVVSFITRGICVATTVYGFGYATKYPFLWAVLGVFLALVVLFTILYFKHTLKKEQTK